jgi:hypothetical protein
MRLANTELTDKKPLRLNIRKRDGSREEVWQLSIQQDLLFKNITLEVITLISASKKTACSRVGRFRKDCLKGPG